MSIGIDLSIPVRTYVDAYTSGNSDRWQGIKKS